MVDKGILKYFKNKNLTNFGTFLTLNVNVLPPDILNCLILIISLCFQEITFPEFRSFYYFLNNLEDFAIAMQLYALAGRSVGQGNY